MKTFEVTASGFKGASDATDDRVLWVNAPSEEDVLAAIEELDAGFHGQIMEPGEGDIDYTLPRDLEALQARLREAFVRRYVPSGEYVFGCFYSREKTEPYKTGVVVADGLAAARERAMSDLRPRDWDVVRLLETRPHPRFMAQMRQAKIWYDAQDAARNLLIEQERAKAPVLRVHLGLEQVEGRASPQVESWISWIRSCLNVNTNRLLVHVSIAPDSKEDPVLTDTRVDMDVDLRLKSGDGKPIPDEDALLSWAAACLNCNTNRVVATVSLREAASEVEADRFAERARA